MTLKQAVNEALQNKIKGKSPEYARLAKESGTTVDLIRGRVRRKHKKYLKNRKIPKVLVFDIETAPLVTYIWNRWQKYIPDSQLIEDWYVMSWAGKWLFEDKIMSDIVTPEESKARDDKRVVESLWKLLNEADVVIAHNGLRFDVKVMNGRFFKHQIDLPMPYQVIDTFKHSTKRFKLPSHGLNYIAEYLGLESKKPTDFKLWVDCMKGNEKQLKRMDDYCRQDVKVLEDVYLKMRKYVQPHPNLGVFIETDAETCPSCGSDNLEKQGQYATTVNTYDAYRCKCCGSITRSRRSNINVEKKEHITSSVPK